MKGLGERKTNFKGSIMGVNEPDWREISKQGVGCGSWSN